MYTSTITLVCKVIGTICSLMQGVEHYLDGVLKSSRIIRTGAERSLYRTQQNDLFWLNSTSYVDRCIIDKGVFEPYSTNVVKRLVKKGDIVLDVGANIGYYSVLMSKLVGEEGRVVCFEPTEHFGKVLKQNIAVNNLKNVELYSVGLSNKEQDLEIQIGENSATLHVPGNQALTSCEKIKLVTLDHFIEEHLLPRIDFIKVDIDGHEPLFFHGAWKTLELYEPVVLLEVSHLHYLNAGYTAWDFYQLLKKRGYRIYHEDDLIEINSTVEFLQKCGNFSTSANIIIAKRQLV